jgi:hypothetical protein
VEEIKAEEHKKTIAIEPVKQRVFYATPSVEKSGITPGDIYTVCGLQEYTARKGVKNYICTLRGQGCEEVAVKSNPFV